MVGEELHELTSVTRLRGCACIVRSGGWKDYNGVERFCKHYIEVGLRSSCMHNKKEGLGKSCMHKGG